ncbi:FAD-dependent oxidoreductase [Flavisphingomonas formosensis]|uniref:FAD-dependent oxidoreductase n=1 Tax=Flavisphingomonas formosensis TaxID=861534 RepID=UPI0012FCF4B3|nr:FAD-dependent oxidoreductase [Sphingomonas formosensis]
MAFETIALGDVERFDETTDVLVIGLGAAGAGAAIEARRAGADVTVIERASAGGGSTALSGGFIYLGGGTRVQKLNGIEDSAQDMYLYLREMSPEADPAKARLYADSSVDHFDWIEANAVPFDDRFYPHKHYEHSSAESLAWTGNEQVWPYREIAKPAPRGHKMPGKDEKHVGVGETGGGGQVLMEGLIATAETLGVRIECDANARQLIVDADGRVVGLRYTRFQQDHYVRARRGVVLATGGFSMNQEMMDEYCPVFADEVFGKLGSGYVQGVGHRLGESAGGVFEHMDGFFITSPFYPPESLLKAILVNVEGKRFVAEDSYHSRSTAAVLAQPERRAYLICDNAIFGRCEYPHDLIDAWETVEEMERDLKLPEGALQKTMANYNAHAASGEDPEFRKLPKWVQPLTEAPFAAIDCSIGSTPILGFTLGGLKTSAKGEVLYADGRPIPGLYAAGACASNLAYDSMGYSTGTCIGESTFFGRQCGKYAAAQAAA